jgi:hypothetical protein
MNNLNDSLPDLMRRATENLEPESTDLVERGIHRGTTLRRRRTALLSLSGTGAVLATAGIVIGGTQLLGGTASEAPAAGLPFAVTASTPPPTKPTRPTAQAATPETALASLRALLPKTFAQSRPYSWGDKHSHLSASVILDDGKGQSYVDVHLTRSGGTKKCTPGREGLENCRVRPDGTVLTWSQEAVTNPSNPGKPARTDSGVRHNSVQLTYKDGRVVALTSYNSPGEKVKETRTKPLLTVEQLTTLAADRRWPFPTAEAVKWPSDKPSR